MLWSAASQVQLQLLQPPTLADSSFQIAAAFSSPIASFNVSSMDLVHAAVAAIRRSNDTSFTLGFTGTPGKLASIQLKVSCGRIVVNAECCCWVEAAAAAAAAAAAPEAARLQRRS